MPEHLKVMVVDDTITYRMIMKKVAETIPGIEVVASAPNGKVALDKISTVMPDVVLCDVEMPVMDGLTTLKEVSKQFPKVTVVMVSGLSRSNANIIMECLNAGALDFVTKPLESNADQAMRALRLDLEPILSVIVTKKSTPGAPPAPTPATPQASAPTPAPTQRPAPGSRPAPPARPGIGQPRQPFSGGTRGAPAQANRLPPAGQRPQLGAAAGQQPRNLHRPAGTGGLAARQQPGQPPAAAGMRPQPRRPIATPSIQKVKRPELLLIGSSTGGPAALTQVLAGLGGKKLSIPTLIVQHMPPVFTASLAAQLTRSSGLQVDEADEGVQIGPGSIVLAQGGKHMTLRCQGKQFIVSLNDGPKVNECRPAVDVLFMSIAAGFPGQTLSIILTGMGRDGTNGIDALKRTNKTYSITQDQDSCVVYGMPRSVVEKGLSDEALPLTAIGSRIQEICGV
uniref:Protein-glutamate methylesterase/protein-glutamine glutaminase n=1 Tax=Magnetococcus massalia (strain MO-1) TaxID=451514 RepID=A0A1S7LNL6_MAGMO|nr:putative response regulator receiver modulated CheB methylesterase (cheB) [Candidatus Magnetococcus massalia]